MVCSLILTELYEIWKTTSNIFLNGRRPQLFLIEDDLNFFKWKTISIVFEIKGDLIFFKLEDDLNILVAGR